jgi:hypothetical protein
MLRNGTLAAGGLLALWIATSSGGCAAQMEGDPYDGPITEDDLGDAAGGTTAGAEGGASSGLGGASGASSVSVVVGGVATIGGATSAASTLTSSVGGGASTAAATSTSASGLGGATGAADSTNTTVGATNAAAGGGAATATNAAAGGAAATTTGESAAATTSGNAGTLSDDQCSGISNGSSCNVEGTCSPRVCGLADTGTRDCACSGGVWDCTSCAWTQPYPSVAEPPTSPLPACTGVEADNEPCSSRGARCDDGDEVCACWLEDAGQLVWDCDDPPPFWD